jgi:hypothetical protein
MTLRYCEHCGKTRRVHLYGRYTLKRPDGVFVVQEAKGLCPTLERPTFKAAEKTRGAKIAAALAGVRNAIQEMLEESVHGGQS